MLIVADLAAETTLQSVITSFLATTLPILSLILFAGAAAVFLQTGFLIKPVNTLLDMARLSPARGVAKIFSLDASVDLLKSVVKATILGWAVWKGVNGALPNLMHTLQLGPFATVGVLSSLLGNLLTTLLVVQLLITVLDVTWVRYRFSSKLKMSLQDIKQESREAEGDPVYKSRLRQIRMARARKRMMAAVAKATVVITNPTHYAVALSYEQGGKSAPRIVAKGVDEVAARIRAAAERSGVSIVPNPLLARSLYTMPLDAEITPEHFKTVAEIIAYVWRLKSQVGVSG